VVGWNTDAGNLGARVSDYLNRKLGGQSLADIDPTDFFPLGGVAIEDDLIQFPESNLYSCPQNDLVIFRSDPPNNEWLRFINSILDAAQRHGGIKELYTIGSMVTLDAHTAPRQLIAIFNSPELKEALGQYNLARNMNYQSPPGQRPTLNSFVSWTARQRNIPGANLWVPIPFYLLATEDPGAEKKVIEFLDRRLGLGIDFQDLDEAMRQQDERIARLRDLSPEIDEYIRKLESNVRLSEEENEKLVTEIQDCLGRKRD